MDLFKYVILHAKHVNVLRWCNVKHNDHIVVWTNKVILTVENAVVEGLDFHEFHESISLVVRKK